MKLARTIFWLTVILSVHSCRLPPSISTCRQNDIRLNVIVTLFLQHALGDFQMLSLDNLEEKVSSIYMYIV